MTCKDCIHEKVCNALCPKGLLPYQSSDYPAETFCLEFKNKADFVEVKEAAVDIGYLSDWYQNSIDDTKPPVWTDEHLEELTNDFIIIPKDTPTTDAENSFCSCGEREDT